MPYKSVLSNGGGFLVALLVSSLNLSQSAFLKFHCLTGLLEVEATSSTGVMSDGQCWDLGNFSSTWRVGDGWATIIEKLVRMLGLFWSLLCSQPVLILDCFSDNNVHEAWTLLQPMSIPYPPQTMLRGPTRKMTTWLLSTLYRGERG